MSIQQFTEHEALTYLASRVADSHKLIADIMSRIQSEEGSQNVKSILPYCEIFIKQPSIACELNNRTHYILSKGPNNSGPAKPITFNSIEQLVAYILRKWW